METDTQPEVEAIRAQIQALLDKDETEYSRLIALASELAKYDTENVRFTTDAGVVGKFGKELFSRQETAVAELIKNGYDADATQATLVFKDASEPGGRLEIEDDGHGMTREQLIEGFMRISSDTKVREPKSLLYKRQRAGRKGIGRFATQHLGRKLVITTQTREAEEALRVTFNWEDFEAGRDLGTVTSRIETVPKVREQGTRLDIMDLRDSWTEAAIRRVYRYVSGIIQPFPLSERTQQRDVDPGFHVSIYDEGGEDYELIADERTQIYEHSLAVIEGEVDGKGHGKWAIESKKLDIAWEEHPIGAGSDEPEEPFAHLRDVKFKLHYFIYLKEYIPRLQRKKIQDLAKKQGGVRVYRNGLRVAPYAEPDDDWIGLDESTRARRILPPHANNNFFGLVEIVDPSGEQFDEKSSREGLIRNAAFEELQDLLYRSIRGSVFRVAEERDRKQTAGQKNWGKGESASEEMRSASKRVADIAEKASEDDKADPEFAEALQDEAERLEEEADRQEEKEKRQLEELAMMRILAGLGLSVGEFAHEIRHPINAIRTDATSLSAQPSSSDRFVSRIKKNADNLEAYTAYLEQAISENTQRDLKVEDLRVVIDRFVESVSATIERGGVTMKKDVEGYDLYPRPLHPSEWASILFNFFTNARKANASSMLLRAGRTGEDVYLEFIDDGDGIAPKYRDRVFNPFFTTTGTAGRYVDSVRESTGMGLGLKIVRDIATGYDGRVLLSNSPDGYATCFRVELPAATDEEVDTYGDD